MSFVQLFDYLSPLLTNIFLKIFLKITLNFTLNSEHQIKEGKTHFQLFSRFGQDKPDVEERRKTKEYKSKTRRHSSYAGRTIRGSQHHFQSGFKMVSLQSGFKVFSINFNQVLCFILLFRWGIESWTSLDLKINTLKKYLKLFWPFCLLPKFFPSTLQFFGRIMLCWSCFKWFYFNFLSDRSTEHRKYGTAESWENSEIGFDGQPEKDSTVFGEVDWREEPTRAKDVRTVHPHSSRKAGNHFVYLNQFVKYLKC